MNCVFLLVANSNCVTCGDNACGQLGHVTSGDLRPAVVDGLVGKGVNKVACGDFFTVACTNSKHSH